MSTRTTNFFGKDRKDVKNPDESAVYRETQRFRQITIALSVVMGIALGIASYGGIKLIEIALLSIFPIVFTVFYIAKLTTEVREDALYIKFYPFHRSPIKIPYKNIEEYHPKKYNPVLDYGGWGIRNGNKEKAYTVTGKKGVRIGRSNGQPILIGSQQPHKLIDAIDQKTDS